MKTDYELNMITNVNVTKENHINIITKTITNMNGNDNCDLTGSVVQIEA